jgi:hypothetical protein
MYIKSMIFTTLVALLDGNHHYAIVNALPNGSPVCTVGGPAVRSAHLSNPNNISGSIEFGSFAVKIGSKTLNSSIVNTIDGNKDLPLVLSSVNGTQFRGVLIILNQPNVSLLSNLFISPSSTDYKPQVNCSTVNYAGFTHVINTLKDSATATINLPINQSAFLDVNVVAANNASISIYFYTRFQLVAETPAPTSAPIKAPTKAPTKAPVKPPTKAPTKAPTVAPTEAPTKAPIREDCGLFGLNIFCFNGCGLFGRLLGFCD